MKYSAVLVSVIFLLFLGFSYNGVKTVYTHSKKQLPAENILKSSTNFHAHLSGSEEVPSVKTNAQGEATFKLSKDGKSINYKITVSDLEDVNMAHIHQGAAGKDGPIVVWLYPPGQTSAKLIQGKTNGVLAEGTITDADLTGPLSGKSISDLLQDIKDGNVYVNVHTKENPAGEIRGQIK